MSDSISWTVLNSGPRSMALPDGVVRGSQGVLHVVGNGRRVQHLVAGQILQRDRLPPGEGMPGRDGQHRGLAEQDRTRDQIGLLDRERDERQVEFAGAEQPEEVAVTGLPDLHLAGRMPGLEHLAHLCRNRPTTVPMNPTTSSPYAPAGGDRPGNDLPRLLEGGPQAFLEVAADGREHDPAAGALEQRYPDLALHLPDRLADPRGGHVQALGGAAEMQLLGEGQEDLDLALLHHVPPGS